MARVAGVGTDLTQISRFSRFVEQEKTALLDRLFTASEQAYAMPKRNPAPHLAARFAAKEATLKALGVPPPSLTSSHLQVSCVSGSPSSV